MNPNEYAQALVKKQGPKKAHEMAEGLVKLCETVAMEGGGALGDEIEVKEQTEIKNGTVSTTTVTLVDNAARDLRQARTRSFWQNVHFILRKSYPQT